LEEFLVPNGLLDWSVPPEMQDFFGESCSGRVNHLTDFFKGFKAARPRPGFWETEFDEGVERAVSGSFVSEKVLKIQILGDDLHLQKLLKRAHETDMLEWTTPSYSQIFWIFFKPSPGLQQELDDVYDGLHLTPNEYSAVHCRVRHPKATAVLLDSKYTKAGGPDRAGLKWDGESRSFAIETATRALQCLATVTEAPDMPVYFYSDSEDLVHYMAHELADPNFTIASNASFRVEAAARKAVQPTRVVGRRIDSETLHIDRQAGHPPAAYYASFVDLLVAARAKCIAMGVGNYAMFASKLSGNSHCLVQYQGEAWGDEGVKGKVAQQCKLPGDL